MDPRDPQSPQDPANPQPPYPHYPPASSGGQEDYSQPDYHPTTPGGYSTHDQPTEAYGQAQGQQSQGGYGGYQPQQPYNNINAPKKGTPGLVWGAVVVAVIVLVGGGVLLFSLLGPKSNSPSGATTPQPTSVAGQPTNAATLPTGEPQGTPLGPTPDRASPEPTRVLPKPTSAPVQGQGGFEGTPHDATNAFFNYLQAGNYAAARALLAPELQAETDVSQMEAVWQTVQTTISGVDVGDATESGDTASVAVTFHIALVDTTEDITVGLRKDGGRWYITDPLGGALGPS